MKQIIDQFVINKLPDLKDPYYCINVFDIIIFPFCLVWIKLYENETKHKKA